MSAADKVVTTLVFAIAILFIYSGVAKLLSLRSFIHGLYLIPYFPHELAPLGGVVVVVAELSIGTALLLGLVWAKIAACMVLVVFTAVALVAHYKKQNIPCNCFGLDSSEYISAGTALRNVVLLAILIASTFIPGVQISALGALNAVLMFSVFILINKAVNNHKELVRSQHTELL